MVLSLSAWETTGLVENCNLLNCARLLWGAFRVGRASPSFGSDQLVEAWETGEQAQSKLVASVGRESP